MFDVFATAAPAYTVMVEGDVFRFAAANAACLAMAGLTTSFHPGLTPHDCFHADIADAIVARYRACRESRQATSHVSEVQLADGPRKWRTTLVPMVDTGGNVTSLFAILGDAGEAPGELRVTTNLSDPLPLLIDAIEGGFWTYDVATKTFETSTSLTRLLAGPGHKTLGLAEYLNHVHADDLGAGFAFYPDTDRTTVEYRVVTHEGRTRWLESRRRVMRDRAGNATKVVSLVVDITAQKSRLRTLETEAKVDPLTSLDNRRSFERAAFQGMRRMRAEKQRMALLLIDLDGFKAVNDRLGHAAGDAILRKVARRLARQVRTGDTLARIGGDEFAVLIVPGAAEVADATATRIARAFDKPFTLDGASLTIGVSIGLAVSLPDDIAVSTLIERADRDLYASKLGRRKSA